MSPQSVVLAALLIIGIGAALLVAPMVHNMVTSGSQAVNIEYAPSSIKINPLTGDGVIYINIYNVGPGVLDMLSIAITDQNGSPYTVIFNAYSNLTTDNPHYAANSTWSGSPGVGFVGHGGPGKDSLRVPEGGAVTITLAFTRAYPITSLFNTDTTYTGLIHPTTGPDIQIQIHSIAQ